MINLTALVLFCCVVQATMLISFIISARKWVRKMNAVYRPTGFKSNLIIESSLSMDL